MKRRPGLARVLALGVAFAQIAPGTVAIAEDEMVTLDFRNVEISEFIKTVSKITNRNFLIDQSVRGTITILGPEPVPISEIWRVFHSVLEVKQLAVVKVGSLYKIIQRRDAKGSTIPVVVGRDPVYFSEEPIIQIVPLEFFEAKEAKGFLDKFVGKDAQIFEIAATNNLVIVEAANNIVKLLKLINELDRPEDDDVIEIVKLEYMSADSAAKLLKEIGSSGISASKDKKTTSSRRRRRGKDGGSSGGDGENTVTSSDDVKIIADSRMSRLILVGPQEDVDALLELLARLDTSEEQDMDQMVNVYKLQHADAESLASTLNAIATGQREAQKRGDDKTRGNNTGGGQVKIVADTTNNALIFLAEEPAHVRQMMSVLEELDTPKPQVYVEAAIVEVGLDDTGGYSFGVGAAKDTEVLGEEATVFGAAAVGQSPIINPQALLGLSGLFGGLFVDIDGEGSLPPLGAILQAFRGNSRINVLSTPKLLTSDNEEAEIVVGNNVPFLTGQTATSGGNVISSIDRRDVGITLRVTPQINDSNEVRLEIFQEISSVNAAPSGLDVNQQGLTTRKRSARTNVVVADGQTIAIGGLIEESENIEETKVPLLGDIPIIGWLFKSRTKRKTRTNLVIFLSPKIVRTSQELQVTSLKYSDDVYNSTEAFLSDAQSRFFMGIPRNVYASAATPESVFDRMKVLDLGDAPDPEPAPTDRTTPVTGAAVNSAPAPVAPIDDGSTTDDPAPESPLAVEADPALEPEAVDDADDEDDVDSGGSATAETDGSQPLQ